jgi:Family of unknown function (DUF6221)
MSQTRDSDLMAFLAARLDEDELWAARSGGDPAREFREIEAKRSILAAYRVAIATPESQVSVFIRGQDDGYRQAYLDVLRALVALYGDHPDYLTEWAPRGG